MFFNTAAAIGYQGDITAQTATGEVMRIFGRMNGTIDDGKSRTADLAVSLSNTTASLYPEESKIELCPVIRATTVGSSEEFHRRMGGIIVTFSEKMDGDPNNFIVLDSAEMGWQEKSDDGKTGAPHWVDDTHMTAKCCYRITGKGGTYGIRIKGNAKALILEGNLYLDGNKIAPNQDDYVIKFKVHDCDP